VVDEIGAPRLNRPRVLVADDDDPIRLLCKVSLELEGIDVVEAADGNEAVALARAERPDVAVLDVAMPGLDGWQVAERLRTDPATQTIPLVFLTALPRARAVDEVDRWQGEYVGKPFDASDLLAAIRRAVAAA